MATPRPYNFVAVVGMSPAIITETIFEIHNQKGTVPRIVHLITTGHGAPFVRAKLLGEDVNNPFSQKPFPDTEVKDRWTPFCADVLGRSQPVEVRFHVPEVNGRPLDDVREKGDDTQFANQCYALVEKLTRPDELPLIGSIAGGRKTMGAHLMTAFSVFARRTDMLTHVLVHDPDLEKGDFFYPTPEEHGRKMHRMLDLVDIQFPPVRELLSEKGVLDSRSGDRRSLEAILSALTPYIHPVDAVKRIDLVLDASAGTARVDFGGEDETLDTLSLTAATAATFAVFAEHCAEISSDEAVPAPRFYDTNRRSAINAQRDAIGLLCGETRTASNDPLFKAWTEADHVSKAISSYRQRLQDVPLATRMLDIERHTTDPSSYNWPMPLPPIRVRAAYPDAYEGTWPFDTLNEPVQL